jgi:hypothetical protein
MAKATAERSSWRSMISRARARSSSTCGVNDKVGSIFTNEKRKNQRVCMKCRFRKHWKIFLHLMYKFKWVDFVQKCFSVVTRIASWYNCIPKIPRRPIFMTFWYFFNILYFYGHLVVFGIFHPFWFAIPRKFWQPWFSPVDPFPRCSASSPACRWKPGCSEANKNNRLLCDWGNHNTEGKMYFLAMFLECLEDMSKAKTWYVKCAMILKIIISFKFSLWTRSLHT